VKKKPSLPQPDALTHAGLQKFQRSIAASVMRPQGTAAGAAVRLIKPNARLTAHERLDIYHQQYWLRILGSLREDFPALAAALGEAKFERLARAYLAAHPSRSFTLRNLGRHLEAFVLRPAHRRLTAPHTALAADLARFEWAQVVAFDEGEIAPVTAEQLAGADPARLRLRLQPYLSVLRFAHPVDHFVLALQREDRNRTEASQAMAAGKKKSRASKKTPVKPSLPQPAATFLAIHRVDTLLFTKPLPIEAFRLLTALAEGRTIARACTIAFLVPKGRKLPDEEVLRRGALLQEWFTTWAELGWFALRK